MTQFNNGDRVTIEPGATWGDAATAEVNEWVFEPGAEVYIYDTGVPDSDGDLYLVNYPNVNGQDDLRSEYVNARFVKPYGGATNEADYTFDPGGTVIDFDSTQEGDTIAVGRGGGAMWLTGKVTRKNNTRLDTDANYTLTWRDYANDTIRLLNRPEKPADPVQVQALETLLGALPMRLFKDVWDTTDDAVENLSAALVEAGVTAQVTDA